jgi:hypothetical protein
MTTEIEEYGDAINRVVVPAILTHVEQVGNFPIYRLRKENGKKVIHEIKKQKTVVVESVEAPGL